MAVRFDERLEGQRLDACLRRELTVLDLVDELAHGPGEVVRIIARHAVAGSGHEHQPCIRHFAHHTLCDLLRQNIAFRPPDEQRGRGDTPEQLPGVVVRNIAPDSQVAVFVAKAAIELPGPLAAVGLLQPVAHAVANIVERTARVEPVGHLDKLVEFKHVGSTGEPDDVLNALARRLGTDVDEDERPHLRRVTGGVGHGVEAAHAMSNEDERFEANSFTEALDIVDEGFARIVAIISPVAVAVATLVERDKAELASRPVGELVEHVAGYSETVEHKDSRSGRFTPLLIAERQRADGRALFLVRRGSDHAILRGGLKWGASHAVYQSTIGV